MDNTTRKPNHTCKLCDEKYFYCNSCETKNQFESWRTLCDTEAHYKVYQVILWYCREIVNEEEAREMLEKCDLSDKDTYNESARQILDKIYFEKNNIEDIETKQEKKSNYKPRKRKPVLKNEA